MLLNLIQVLRVYTETKLSLVTVFLSIKEDIQRNSTHLLLFSFGVFKYPKARSVFIQTLPGQVDTFEPVEDIHPLLGVQHPHEAGEDGEDGGLRGPEAVHDQGGLVGAGGGQAGDAVHQVHTVTDRHTQVRPVGAKHHLVMRSLVSTSSDVS